MSKDNQEQIKLLFETKDKLLIEAYHSALNEAERLNCESVAFSLLSSGVFRGERELQTVLNIGFEAIQTWIEENQSSGVKKISMMAYTEEEKNELEIIFKNKQN